MSDSAPETSTANLLAIIAFIAAFLLPPAGIVAGFVALSRKPERRGLAIAATVLGFLFTIVGIVSLVLYVTQLAYLAGM